jgi:hypothetical protein
MKRAAPQVEVKAEYDALRILFNGVLHVHLIRSKFLGMQSWMRRPEGKYCIEFTMADGTITCDYDSQEKWQAVLDGLAKTL